MKYAALVLLGLAAFGPAQTWVETTGPDFYDGAFDNNIYSSSRGGGAVEFVPRADLNQDGLVDAVCPDDSGPWLRLYFNSPSGFDSARSRNYPITGGGGLDVADLDCDGHADMVHAAWHTRSVIIYWGTDSGPSPTDTTWLRTGGRSEATSIADLDHDSYLDILATTDSGTVCVFWGSSTGYSNINRSAYGLLGKIGHNLEIADFDRDGYADIAAVSWTTIQGAVVYMGPGRMVRRLAWLPLSVRNPHGITAADFDRNGWLDLVFSGYDTMVTTFVYWGTDSGFSDTNRVLIHPGSCYGGSAAGYFDSDSTLDLLMFRGDFASDTTVVPMVYFNDTGSVSRFSDARTALVGTNALNASGGMIEDFDQDGADDVLLLDHNPEVPSLVLYGPGWTRLDVLPAVRSHHGHAREFGNVYDRRHEETYRSSVFDAGVTVLWRRVSWDDTMPAGTGNEMALRTGPTPAPDTAWSDWLVVANGESLSDTLSSRYCQYRSVFDYQTPAVLPMLFEVRIDYESLPFHDVGPTAIVAPVDTVDSGFAIVPRVVVENFGNRRETFPVTLAIGTSYLETVAETLARGLSDTVEFPVWVGVDSGAYAVVCYTSLADDGNRSNDTIADTAWVKLPPRPDVGPVVLLSPSDRVDSGTVHTPAVVVRNFGVVPAAFPTTVTIGTEYTATVDDSLEPGQSDTLQFPDWTATRVGREPISCYTGLRNDGNRANDTLADSVRVLRLPVADVSVQEILVPNGYADSGASVVPAAVVHNYGPVPGAFPVTMRIGAGYAETVPESLDVDETDTLFFPGWTAQPMDTIDVVCFTALTGDTNPSNDTARARVVVQEPALHDLGTEVILEPPSRMYTGDSVRPRARVRNRGTRAERYFDVEFRIGGAYDRTVNVSVLLPPDSAVEVEFPAWKATAGAFTASCSTRLAGDADNLNDKQELQFEVVRPYLLLVEADQSDHVESGLERTYYFTARLDGVRGATIDLTPLPEREGWSAALYDSAGTAPISGLGFLVPDRAYPFSVQVQSPAAGLTGAIDTLAAHTFVVRGFAREDTSVTDSALLTLTLVPTLAVHNFPNPLDDSTTFVIGLPEDGKVSLSIYSRAGEQVCRVIENRSASPGVLLVGWTAENDAGRPIASGTYRYVLEYVHGDVTDRVAKKLVVVRR